MVLYFTIHEVDDPGGDSLSMREVAEGSFGEDFELIAKYLKGANFITLYFEDVDLGIGYLVFDGFGYLKGDVLVCLFVMPSAPLMSFTVVTDFD